MKPRLLILSSRFPYPLEKGDKLRLYMQIRDLSSVFDLYLFVVGTEHVSTLDPLKPFLKAIKIERPGRIHQFMSMASGLLRGLPLQVSMFWRSAYTASLNTFLSEHPVDLVYCQMVRMFPYTKQCSAPVILDYMDALSLSFEKRSRQSTLFKKRLFRFEAQRLKSYEQCIASQWDSATIISDRDKEYLNIPSLHVIPNGVDTETYFEKEETKHAPVFTLLFVGNMQYSPNITAAKTLVEKILPLVKTNNIRCILAGASPTSAILSLQSNTVEVTGFVENIVDAYHSADLFIAPISSGAGLQNKLLEAMSCGVPCITTHFANESLGAEHNTHLLIADKYQDFALKIDEVLSDSELRTRLGKEGRQFVKEHYAWKAHNNALSQLLLQCLRNQSTP